MSIFNTPEDAAQPLQGRRNEQPRIKFTAKLKGPVRQSAF